MKVYYDEDQSGAARMQATRRRAREHPIEQVGARPREMMPWMSANRLADQNES